MEQFHFIKLSLQLRCKSVPHLWRWKWHNYVLSRVYKLQTNSKGQWIRKVAFPDIFLSHLGCNGMGPGPGTQIHQRLSLMMFSSISDLLIKVHSLPREKIFLRTLLISLWVAIIVSKKPSHVRPDVLIAGTRDTQTLSANYSGQLVGYFKIAGREDIAGIQIKETINVWGNGYTNYPIWSSHIGCVLKCSTLPYK